MFHTTTSMTCQKVRISLAVPPSYLPTKYVDSLSDQIASLPGTSQKATMGSTEKKHLADQPEMIEIIRF